MARKIHTPPTATPLMTLSDVAAYLQVAERTVYLWSHKGELPGFKLGNVWRYNRAEIDAWIETSRAATPRRHA